MREYSIYSSFLSYKFKIKINDQRGKNEQRRVRENVYFCKMICSQFNNNLIFLRAKLFTVIRIVWSLYL